MFFTMISNTSSSSVDKKNTLSIIAVYDMNNVDSLVPLLSNAVNNGVPSLILDKNMNSTINLNFVFFLLSPTMPLKKNNAFIVNNVNDIDYYNTLSTSLSTFAASFSSTANLISNESLKKFTDKHVKLFNEYKETFNNKHLIKNVLAGEDTRIKDIIKSLTFNFEDHINVIKNDAIMYKLGINKIPVNFLHLYPKRYLVNLSFETLTNIISNDLDVNKTLTSSIISATTSN